MQTAIHLFKSEYFGGKTLELEVNFDDRHGSTPDAIAKKARKSRDPYRIYEQSQVSFCLFEVKDIEEETEIEPGLVMTALRHERTLIDVPFLEAGYIKGKLETELDDESTMALAGPPSTKFFGKKESSTHGLFCEGLYGLVSAENAHFMNIRMEGAPPSYVDSAQDATLGATALHRMPPPKYGDIA